MAQKINITTFILGFLLLQPFIDLLVCVSNIWPSVIRGGFLFGVVFYLFLTKQSRIYLCFLSVYILLHLAVLIVFKDPVSMDFELSYVIKTLYFSVILLLYRQIESPQRLYPILMTNMVVLNAIMLLATLTDSGKRTYNMLAKLGHTGWFFSGNELSVIFAIGIVILIIDWFNCLTRQRYISVSILIIIHSYHMLIIGTKVSLFSLLIVLASSIVVMVVKGKQHSALYLTLLLTTVLLLLPLTPAGHNTMRLVNNQQTELEGEVNLNPSINEVLSGRRDFLADNLEQFNQAPLLLKLFGLGYGGLYSTSPKLVEMDGFDWLFGFGLVGFALLLYPLIKTGLDICLSLRSWRSPEVSLLLLAISLAAGSSLTAGHVLSAPAVSIYLACLVMLVWQYFIGEELQVLVITTMYPSKKYPSFGIFIKNQVKQLQAQQIKVTVLSIKSLKMGKTNVIVKYMTWMVKFLIILIFTGQRYQVVHSHYIFPSGWLGLMTKKVYRSRFIVTAHGGDVDRMPRKHPWIAKRSERILAEADEVIAVGEALAQALRKGFNVSTEKLTILNMGVNREIFKAIDGQKARKILNLSEHKIIILFVGNLIEAKGIEDLLMACQQLATKYDLECHLIGAKKEPEFLNQLMKEVSDDFQVHHATNQTAIATWLSAADVFVLPSHLEGFGLAALEAMSCRTPVIGTNVGGLSYLLDDGAGLKVPPYRPDVLAEGIERVISDHGLSEKLIQNGEEKAKQFDQQLIIAKLIKLYNNKE
ncbi:Glycosyltransferase involved in cell wall bisynthesis [Amphibacillus marinus]|uniref:Glycosyltransferase involved in cell wall bisynthesis n=1 Tax=Amphibacillus marinus TaxID=872970 RepID=A0A1H8N3X1_9BACI|nr:O-antigen ligase family protein [Amphibacillus marinus]SEO24262.1 Glycosyltransferase involved in cell wall bisynthesis [Amphibacillus marinus]